MKQAFFIISSITMVLFVLASAYIFRSHTLSQQALLSAHSPKIHIVTSFYPLGEFARQVGGDLVDVSVIVPAGVEPHEYEPTPQDIASIYTADIFIANGAGMDAWATKIQSDLESKGVKVIIMSQSLGFNDHETSDPHFWLDPVLAEKEVENIKNILLQVDVKNQAMYTQNTEAYTKKLQILDQSYTNRLAVCDTKTVMTSHNAFHYLALRYQFEALSITGISPESEPSTRQLADLAVVARQKNMKYIFFETLVSPRLAQTLADEIGAQTLVFNPLEGLTDEENAQGKNYLTVMEENLNNLQLAMYCHEK